MINIYNRQRKYKITDDVKNALERIFKEILLEENILVDSSVDITFTNNKNIRILNKQYRKKDVSTDVLSFPIFTKQELAMQEKLILGDIVVSMERADYQSNEYGHSFERELYYLIVHGLFHLLGYDHMNTNEKQIMRQKEEKILQKIGYGVR